MKNEPVKKGSELIPTKNSKYEFYHMSLPEFLWFIATEFGKFSMVVGTQIYWFLAALFYRYGVYIIFAVSFFGAVPASKYVKSVFFKASDAMEIPLHLEEAPQHPDKDSKAPPPKLKKSSKKDDGKNDHAIKKISAVRIESEEAYIKRFYKTAQAEQKHYGIPASITLAQGIIESRHGSSYLAINANNHFGIKCHKRCGGSHCIRRTDDSYNDHFKRYDSPWKSFRDHSKLLSNPHYSSLHKHGTDYRKWAHGLRKKGYATHENYGEILIATIEKYELYKYDKI